MANCKDCIHYEPCFEYGNILDPIHGGVKCDSFKPTADVAPKSECNKCAERTRKAIEGLQEQIANKKAEVAREIFTEIRKFSKKPIPEAKAVYILSEEDMQELERRFLKTGGHSECEEGRG